MQTTKLPHMTDETVKGLGLLFEQGEPDTRMKRELTRRLIEIIPGHLRNVVEADAIRAELPEKDSALDTLRVAINDLEATYSACQHGHPVISIGQFGRLERMKMVLARDLKKQPSGDASGLLAAAKQCLSVAEYEDGTATIPTLDCEVLERAIAAYEAGKPAGDPVATLEAALIELGKRGGNHEGNSYRSAWWFVRDAIRQVKGLPAFEN